MVWVTAPSASFDDLVFQTYPRAAVSGSRGSLARIELVPCVALASRARRISTLVIGPRDRSTSPKDPKNVGHWERSRSDR